MIRQRPSNKLSDYDQTFLTAVEAAAVLRISRAACYAYIRDGKIPSAHMGSRVVVPRAALARMARESEDASV